MARAAAVYCHPRLSSITTSNTNVNFEGGDVNFTQIFAVPRGALIDQSGKVVIDGEATELTPVTPYEGSPSLSAITDQSQPAPIAERLPVLEVDTTNVTPMRRRDDEGPAGAA